jgi:hypothetical protein
MSAWVAEVLSASTHVNNAADEAEILSLAASANELSACANLQHLNSGTTE